MGKAWLDVSRILDGSFIIIARVTKSCQIKTSLWESLKPNGVI